MFKFCLIFRVKDCLLRIHKYEKGKPIGRYFLFIKKFKDYLLSVCMCNVIKYFISRFAPDNLFTKGQISRKSITSHSICIQSCRFDSHLSNRPKFWQLSLFKTIFPLFFKHTILFVKIVTISSM